MSFSLEPKFDENTGLISIEGISMVSTERTEIGAMLESFGGDIGKMTAKLNVT